jgi:hypothetical protein
MPGKNILGDCVNASFFFSEGRFEITTISLEGLMTAHQDFEYTPGFFAGGASEATFSYSWTRKPLQLLKEFGVFAPDLDALAENEFYLYHTNCCQDPCENRATIVGKPLGTCVGVGPVFDVGQCPTPEQIEAGVGGYDQRILVGAGTYSVYKERPEPAGTETFASNLQVWMCALAGTLSAPKSLQEDPGIAKLSIAVSMIVCREEIQPSSLDQTWIHPTCLPSVVYPQEHCLDVFGAFTNTFDEGDGVSSPHYFQSVAFTNS